MAKQQIIQNTYLSREELSNLARVTKDVLFFSNFVYVINPIHGKVRFNLYPYQKSVLYNFTKERFNIILKFRQAGITELISMYCLWLTMYHPNKKVNIISINDRTSKKVLRKIKFMYKNLPWYMQVPIVNGRAGEYGSACITGDTKILGMNQDICIRDISPDHPGWVDLSNFDFRVLTHEGTFERVLKVFNKGNLKTYKIINDKGLVLKCTPKHKLLTIKGWKTVEEILKSDIPVVFKDTSLFTNISKPEVLKPDTEEIREIKDFPGYWVSNLGEVYTTKTKKGKGHGRDGIDYYGSSMKKMVLMSNGRHFRVKLRHKGKRYIFPVHHLVYKTFIGKMPKDGEVIDHINGNGLCNWITNLQIITYSENTKRAFTMNRNLIASTRIGELLTYQQIGYTKYLISKDKYLCREIVSKLKRRFPDIIIDHKKVSRIRRNKNCSEIYISKIHKIEEFEDTIYDMEVENSHSYITYNGYINHNSNMEFDNGSFIESIPTSPEAGRSESLTLLVIDEAAMVRWAGDVWAAALPTLSTGGSAIVNSTPRGIGGFYHSTWVDSIAGTSGFNPLRLYWRMHPERDDHWYETMAKALGPRRTAQEIDGDFLGSGNTVFDLGDIKAIEDCLSDYPVIKKKFNGQYRQYLEPEPDKEYFIGADVSTGRNTDYSSFTLMDKEGEEQVVYKGRMAPDKFARLLGDTGQLFGNAVIAPESNDVGLAVTSMLQTEGYPKLYYYQKLIRKKGQSRPEMDKAPGWLTTNKNRSVIIEGLERDIREENIIVKDPFFVQEAYTFIYDGLGRPVAMGKHKTNKDSAGDDDEVYADDDIFGKAICNHIRKGKANVIVQPR